MLWNLQWEPVRRRALRTAHGLQANGYPAYEAYGKLNANPMLYLDNRMTPELFATAEEMTRRIDHLIAGNPLRLIHSGRLEPMKGGQDLVPVARELRERGLPFTLDIYGTGSLQEQIIADIVSSGLERSVHLHDPVDFESHLVPIARTQMDIFLSCHRQDDPSCTYLESMGCGLAIAGYDNRMWSAILAQSHGGWAVPRPDPTLLAEKIAEIDKRREEIVECCRRSLRFATAHDLRTEFERRNEHVVETAMRVRASSTGEPRSAPPVSGQSAQVLAGATRPDHSTIES
jgi:colanic acid/amylovoran biosynthesis glycosyltransferase